MLNVILGNIGIYLHFMLFHNNEMAWFKCLLAQNNLLFCTGNAMVIYDLAMQGARSSALVILTYLSQNMPISVHRGLMHVLTHIKLITSCMASMLEGTPFTTIG